MRLGPDAYTVGADGRVTVSFPLPAKGYGCVLVTANSSTAGTPLGGFMARVGAMAAAGPLSSYDPTVHMLQCVHPSGGGARAVSSLAVYPRR